MPHAASKSCLVRNPYALSYPVEYRERQYRTSKDPAITEITSKLTDEQIAEVERTLAEWEPNPADCYVPDEGQATN
jgi:hypothetical protein